MPRTYKPKGGAAGRPPIDDQPLAREVLFATRFQGLPEPDVLREATRQLIEDRSAEAKKSNVPGVAKWKNPIGKDAARRRVKEAIKNEIAVQGDTPLLGAPAAVRKAGEMLATISRRDGLAAGRAALVDVWAALFGWGFDGGEGREMADAWLREIEAKKTADSFP